MSEPAHLMRHGTTKGRQVVNLLGKTIGSYTVVSGPIRVFVAAGTIIKWRCECACGTTQWVAATRLLQCQRENPEKARCHSCGYRARKRGLFGRLTSDER